MRYVVRGLQGTYTKFGVDVQEDQLKVIPDPAQITTSETYGAEPESLWGTVENLTTGDKVVKSMYVRGSHISVHGTYPDVSMQMAIH